MTFDAITEIASKNSSNKEIFGAINDKFPPSKFEDYEVGGDIAPSQIEYFAYNITSEYEIGGFSNVINFTSRLETTTTTEHIAIIPKTQDNVFESGLIIPLYVAIFVLSVVGNSLVLATLAQNKRMRTVTNVYLLNLAVSDLLLGVFCMPFTLVGQVLRSFIFGATMCKLIPYFQAVCVSVGVWTLVAISLERYFAICRPLKSRRWQTQFHAYKMIGFVWISSLMWTSPILLVSRLKALKMGRYKCREEWPNASSERAYNLFLDVILLLVPLVIMTLAYSLIVSKLWKGLKHEIKHNFNCSKEVERCNSTATMNGVVLTKDENLNGKTELTKSEPRVNFAGSSSRSVFTRSDSRLNPNKIPRQGNIGKSSRVKMWLKKVGHQVSLSNRQGRGSPLTATSVLSLPVINNSPGNGSSRSPTVEDQTQVQEETFVENCSEDPPRYTFTRHAIRSNYMDKSIEAKKKVIRMLFVVVAEFFVCWAPIHVLNTWCLFSPEIVYQTIGSTGVSLIQLLAYISSCCNPITYCFMNRKFRQAFLNVFHCYRSCLAGEDGKEGGVRSGNIPGAPNNSEISGNDSTVYVGRIVSTLNRSEIVVLEAEDRV